MNLLIVDDAPLIRTQLTRLFNGVPGVRVVGVASDEAEALDLIAQLQPDTVLLDLALGRGHGFNVLAALQRQGSTCRVLVLSNQHLAAYRTRCLALGAAGFFDKSTDLDRLAAHVRRLAAEPADSLL